MSCERCEMLERMLRDERIEFDRLRRQDYEKFKLMTRDIERHNQWLLEKLTERESLKPRQIIITAEAEDRIQGLVPFDSPES